MNLAHWLLRHAQSLGEQPALACGSQITHTYAELACAAEQGARHWHALGLAPGDRVGLFMGNSVDYIATLWAVWWAGGVVVPMNARLHGREAAYIVGHSGARWCVCDAAHAAELSPHLPSHLPAQLSPLEAGGTHPVTHAGGSDATMEPDDHPAPCTVCLPADVLTATTASDAPLTPPAPRGLGDAAWLFYTSGTTGRPKGVCLSVRNLQHMALAYTATVQAVEPGQTCLHPAPLSHGSGLYHLAYVMNGGLNVVPASGGLDCAELFALATHWGQASVFAAPTIVKRLAAHAREVGHPPSGFATIVCGGAPMYLADMLEAREALGPVLAQIYGQGESPMTITVLPRHMVNDSAHPLWHQRLASVGVAQPMVEIEVRGTDGLALPPGTPGEVCVRGDVVMTGYWRNPTATAASVRDGWLATGDIGMLDGHGLLTLLDRSKDLVISGGNNIYPREVEEALLLHPAVDEVAVVGRPDPEWGESLVAWVVPRAPVTTDELDAHCLAHMARYKRPKTWRLVASLPKNNTGKVLKTELREREAEPPTPRRPHV